MTVRDVPTGRTGEDSLDAERDHTSGAVPVGARSPISNDEVGQLRAALSAIQAMAAMAPDEGDRGFGALLGIESIARHALSATDPATEIGCKHIMFRGGVTGRVVTCGVCDWCRAARRFG